MIYVQKYMHVICGGNCYVAMCYFALRTQRKKTKKKRWKGMHTRKRQKVSFL